MIYVLSDIHGNEQCFQSVLMQINLRPEDQLYILGDVVDRHPGGIPILRQIMAMPNAHMLLGNHEYMMLRAMGEPYDDYLDDGRAMDHWYRNGGQVTHSQLKCLSRNLRREILDYLKALPLQINLTVHGKNYCLVHAAPAHAWNGEAPYRNATHYAVWKRLNPEDPLPEKETLIFGHTPTRYFREDSPMSVWYGANRIGIDCGSGYPDHSGGRLACLRLDDGKEFYSEEG